MFFLNYFKNLTEFVNVSYSLSQYKNIIIKNCNEIFDIYKN
jgi:hypothetical protein